MPKTKAYTDRRKILNELFRSRYYTLDELIGRVGERIGTSVSKKTIQDMIKYMREEGAPIINEPGRGYIYDPKNYNIEDVKVDPATIANIKLAAFILKQIPGLDMHEELCEVFEKLEIRVADSEYESNFIQFDTRPEYTGAKHLAEILEAIKGESVISFDYQPFTHQEPMRITVHPYLLKESNNRWFLLGLPEHLRQAELYDIHQYGLERIKSAIKPEGKIEFFKHHKFDADTFHNNVIGVFIPKEAEVEQIVLRFTKARAAYVKTNPLHQSQKQIEENEKHSTFSYNLIPNLELEALILSYGADAEVLKPETLRKKIADKLKSAADLYF